jgi:hypothetical protein
VQGFAAEICIEAFENIIGIALEEWQVAGREETRETSNKLGPMGFRIIDSGGDLLKSIKLVGGHER